MALCVSLRQGVEGQSFRKAERELDLLHSFNNLLSSQRSQAREDNITDGSNSAIMLRVLLCDSFSRNSTK